MSSCTSARSRNRCGAVILDASLSSTILASGRTRRWFGVENGLGGVGKGQRFRLAVIGKFAGDEKLDPHTGLGVAERPRRAGVGRHITAADEPLLERLQPLGRQENIDVFRHPHVSVLAKGHSTDQGVGDFLCLEPCAEAVQGLVQASFLHEIRTRFAEGEIERFAQLHL